MVFTAAERLLDRVRMAHPNLLDDAGFRAFCDAGCRPGSRGLHAPPVTRCRSGRWDLEGKVVNVILDELQCTDVLGREFRLGWALGSPERADAWLGALLRCEADLLADETVPN
jgi:hypothetical protein